jgi:hypothetical protein
MNDLRNICDEMFKVTFKDILECIYSEIDFAIERTLESLAHLNIHADEHLIRKEIITSIVRILSSDLEKFKGVQ